VRVAEEEADEVDEVGEEAGCCDGAESVLFDDGASFSSPLCDRA